MRKVIQRTVVNTLGDGSTVVFADPHAQETDWELQASGMTLAEWNAIEALFLATSGMWLTFTFLDPTGNLLTDSEAFGTAAWTNGALVELTTGIADPLGTTRATQAINAGAGVESVAQTLAIPGNFCYCLSVWARTSAASSVTLTISTTGGSKSQRFSLTGTWQRLSVSGNLAQATTSVTFGAQLDIGGTVDLFGMQVDAQPGASDYKMTETHGGVYAKARFGIDKLVGTAQSTDVYDAVIRIVDTEG
jgi:hypothetical protein